MPIFTRRAIQMMLDDLAPCMTKAKAKDLVHRLDHSDPDQAIPHEYELALTWATSKVAHVEIERPVGAKAPDIYSADFFPDGPAYIEVAAVSDVALSGETVMKRAANIITNFANTLSKRAGRHLLFEFQEESGYALASQPKPGTLSFNARSQYFRRRKITAKFMLTDVMKNDLSTWVKSPIPRTPLRLTDEEIDVFIVWCEREVHPHGNVFSRMPSEAHDLRDNPIWKVLKDKEREQLSGVPQGTSRWIFICDAGCSLLRHINPLMQHHETVSGSQVIRAFLAQSSIDGVCVFTPGHNNSSNIFQRSNGNIFWKFHIFDTAPPNIETKYDNLNKFIDIIPTPHYEGYQARSLHQQSAFAPQGRGQYLSTIWQSKLGLTSMKISARAFQEYLAGRLTHEDFKRFVDVEMFEGALKRGLTISNITLELRGIENDDDYVVLEFAPDPSAMPFKAPDLSKAGEPGTISVEPQAE